MDQWHAALLSAIGSLASALGVMWKSNLKLRKQLDDLHASSAKKLDNARAEHLEDVKTLTAETIELARAATYAPPLLRSELPPRDSEE